jgi:SAM-dependent methyltransferase
MYHRRSVGDRRYDEDFYDEIDGWSRQSAAAIVPWIFAALSPQSVLDVGCGRGAWLAAFQACGVDDVLGLDGDYVDATSLHIDADRFRAVDLLSPPDLDRSFDLAISLEVAEHLPASAAEPFVRFLTGAAPVVMFSAAVPGQGGVHHVNEQWPAYWAERFARAGFRAVDAVRPQFWNDERVGYFFAQNIVLYARPELVPKVEANLGTSWAAGDQPLPVVHPGMFGAVRSQSQTARSGPPSLSSLLRALPGATRRAVRTRTRRVRQR